MQGQRSGVPDAPSLGCCDRCGSRSILHDSGFCFACEKLEASEDLERAIAAMAFVRAGVGALVHQALGVLHPLDVMEVVEEILNQQVESRWAAGLADPPRYDELGRRARAASGRAGEEG